MKTVLLLFWTICAPLWGAEAEPPLPMASAKSLAATAISRDTPAHLTELGRLVREDGNPQQDEALAGIKVQLRKLHTYNEAMTAPVFQGQRGLPLALAEISHAQGCRDYWFGFKEALKRGHPPSLAHLEELHPPESLALQWMREMNSANPKIREALLALCAQRAYTEATREKFSAIARYLYRKDLSPNVRRRALEALGTLSDRTAEGIDTLLQALDDDKFTLTALDALAASKIPAEQIESALVKRIDSADYETLARIFRTLWSTKASSPQILALARATLQDGDSDLRIQAAQEEAYTLLRINGELFRPLPAKLSFLEDNDRRFESALARAIGMQDLSEVERLVQRIGRAIPPKTIGKILELAAAAGNYALTETLLSLRTEPFDYPPAVLQAALDSSHLTVARLLIDRGAKIHYGDEYLLFHAVTQQRVEEVRLLLEKGAEVHHKNERCLGFAADVGNLALVQLLVEKGADKNITEGLPLRLAAGKGHLSVVKWLIEAGAYPRGSADKDLALCEAAVGKHVEVVDFLLAQGCQLSSVAKDASHLEVRKAASKGQDTFRRYLLWKQQARLAGAEPELPAEFR